MITPGFNDMLMWLTADKDLVFEFFVVFSRFEYALKRAGYVNGDSSRVDANWDRFANDISGNFRKDASAELTEAVNYLVAKPPKTQNLMRISKSESLDWRATRPGTGETGIKWLLHLTRTVRNNLFHGGKFSKGLYDDPARDPNLLRSCLVLLNACLVLDPDVNQYFKGTRG